MAQNHIECQKIEFDVGKFIDCLESKNYRKELMVKSNRTDNINKINRLHEETCNLRFPENTFNDLNNRLICLIFTG